MTTALKVDVVTTPFRTGRGAEDTHYYLPDGTPFYAVPNKSKPGEFRPPTIRDAKAVGAFPGYSEIQSVVAKPGLERWKQEQVLLACLTSPQLSNYQAGKIDEKTFLAHIYECSQEQAAKAAEIGTAGHAAISGHFLGEQIEERWSPTVKAILAWMEREGITGGETEKVFASARHGFGGKVDWHSDAVVMDFKSKDGDLQENDGKKLAYPEHCRQLAAYDCGLRDADEPIRECISVFFSRTHPGALAIHRWSQSEAKREWERFKCHLRDWKLAREYWPGA